MCSFSELHQIATDYIEMVNPAEPVTYFQVMMFDWNICKREAEKIRDYINEMLSIPH